MRKGIKYTLFLIVALASTTIPQINGDINVNPSQWNNLSVVPVKPIPLAQESSEPLNELWTPRIASVQKIWQLMISLSHPLSSKPFKTIPKETDSKTALYDKINRLSWKNWEMTRFIPANLAMRKTNPAAVIIPNSNLKIKSQRPSRLIL